VVVMRIGIVGSGALGLYYGAMLQKAGCAVSFLLRRDYEAILAHGLQVHSVGGDFHLARVQGYRSPEEMGPVDLVVVGLKTFANDGFSRLIGPLLHEETAILTLQNGLGNEDELAALFGARRVLGGVAFLCANREAPGTVTHLGAGRIILGEFAARETQRAETIAIMFRRAGIDCRAVADLMRARWEKLVWNIPFNGLSALMLQPVDVLVRHAKTRALARDMMLEVILAANAQELPAPLPASLADEMLVFTDGMGSYRPSMLIDREEGRTMEIEAILGRPLAAGTARGVGMPKIEALAALLELCENLQ
jgi:2-dehydropantoate 2-reductase